jgi:hypothetical protein
LENETDLWEKEAFIQLAMHSSISLPPSFAMSINRGIHLSDPRDYASPTSILIRSSSKLQTLPLTSLNL